MIRPAPLGAARVLAALAAFATLACAAPEPSRQLYQWTDTEGNVRYTPFPDRIPSEQAHTRQRVERRPSPAPVEAAPFEQEWGAPTTDTPEAPPTEARPPEAPPVEAAPPVETAPPVEAAPVESARVETTEAFEAEVAPEAESSAEAGTAPDAEPDATPADAPDAAPEDALDARIAALESRIAADQEQLKDMISDPAEVRTLRDSAALEEIATRLPDLQAELAQLRAQRAESAPAPEPPEAGAPDDDGR